MSGVSVVGIQLRSLAILIKSIVDLGFEYKKLSSMPNTSEKIHNVELVVNDEFGKDINFEKTAGGEYQIVADSSGLDADQLKRQQDFIKKIRQRYSYNKVTDELIKQGYIIAEEEKVSNNTVRLVARKWS